MAEDSQVDYTRVNAMLLAWQSVSSSAFENKNMAEKAKWLISMGFSRSDAAVVLGSTDNSLRVMLASDAKKSVKS